MCGTKSCAILGHSPMRFAWGFDEEAAECHDMKMELAQQIMVLRQQGVTHFSVACDYGVGLYAAEIINALRNDDPELMLSFLILSMRIPASNTTARFKTITNKSAGSQTGSAQKMVYP